MFKFNNLFFVNFPYFLKKWVIKIKIATQIKLVYNCVRKLLRGSWSMVFFAQSI